MSKKATVRSRWLPSDVNTVDLEPGEQVLGIEPEAGGLHVYIAQVVDWTPKRVVRSSVKK